MNEKTRNALELARDALLDLNSAYAISAIDAIDAALSAPDLNLSDTAVQKRLAAQWGYMPAPSAPVAQPVSAAEEFDAPASCPAREAMGEHACQDRAQCWEARNG